MGRLCQSCIKPISEKRLSALPNCTVCIDCKMSSDEPTISQPATRMYRLGFTSGSSDHPGRRGSLRLGTFGLGAAI